VQEIWVTLFFNHGLKQPAVHGCMFADSNCG
jgi:hypothetical protein